MQSSLPAPAAIARYPFHDDRLIVGRRGRYSSCPRFRLSCVAGGGQVEYTHGTSSAKTRCAPVSATRLRLPLCEACAASLSPRARSDPAPFTQSFTSAWCACWRAEHVWRVAATRGMCAIKGCGDQNSRYGCETCGVRLCGPDCQTLHQRGRSVEVKGRKKVEVGGTTDGLGVVWTLGNVGWARGAETKLN